MVLFALNPEASAYFGMGPLIPMIGSAFILIFTLGVALFGIAAYPLKMMLTKKKVPKTAPQKTTASKAKAPAKKKAPAKTTSKTKKK